LLAYADLIISPHVTERAGYVGHDQASFLLSFT